jgi:hypothetical protein
MVSLGLGVRVEMLELIHSISSLQILNCFNRL